MFRATRLVALLAICAILVGCFPQAITTKQLERLKRFTEPADSNSLYLQTVLLERYVGESFFTNDLWKTTARPMSHEQTTLFAKNGLRVGVFTGLIPGEFAEAIRSEQGTIQPMHRSFQEGVARVVPVQGPIEKVAFKSLKDLAAEPAEYELYNVECGLQMQASPVEKDRVKLIFHPQLQHGDKQALLKPSADGSEFSRVNQKPILNFEALNCEVILGPTDYLILGTIPEPLGTLGGAFFINAKGDRVRQRVLVIRAGRGTPHADPDTVLGR
jgi:hypothetical protein